MDAYNGVFFVVDSLAQGHERSNPPDTDFNGQPTMGPPFFVSIRVHSWLSKSGFASIRGLPGDSIGAPPSTS
jgi:hypothetical protein